MGLNVNAFLNTITSRLYALPVVILYVTEQCNLQCITCSYRKAAPGELSLREIQELAGKLHAFGLRHVAFSGGEPLMRRDFPLICEAFRQYHVKETLLTNGLLLDKRIPEIAGSISEIIVSIDGADNATHDAIRGVASFDRILTGIRHAIKEVPEMRISLRTVVQKKNFRQLPAIITLGHELGVHHVSFLAADMATDAFGRKAGFATGNNSCVILDALEAVQFREQVDMLEATHAEEFRTGFIAQSPEALHHIAAYFAALQGLGPFPRTLCNAPMVSAVITATGDVKPCFFLPEMGNVRASEVAAMTNSTAGRTTRKAVRARMPEACQTCVCTLHVPSASALFDRF